MPGFFDPAFFDPDFFDTGEEAGPSVPGHVGGLYPDEANANGFTLKLNGEPFDLDPMTNGQLASLSIVEMAFDLQIGRGNITVSGDPGWVAGDRLSFYSTLGTFISCQFVMNRGRAREGQSRTTVQTTVPLMDANRQGIGRAVYQWERPQETATDRLLAFVDDWMSDLSMDTTTFVDTDATAMEAKTYNGDGLVDLVADLITYTGKTVFIRAIEDAEYELHFHAPHQAGYESDITISDVIADTGDDVYFPIQPTREYQSDDLAVTVVASNGIESHTEGASSPTAGGLFFERLIETNVSPDLLTGVASAVFANTQQEKLAYTAAIGPMPAEQLARILAGMNVITTSQVMDAVEYNLAIPRREIRLAADISGNYRTGWWIASFELGFPSRVATTTVGYGGDGGKYGALNDLFNYYDHSEAIYGDLAAVPVGGAITVIGRMRGAQGATVPVAGKTMQFVCEEFAADDVTASDDWSLAGESVIDSHTVTATTNVAGDATVQLIHESNISWAKVRVVPTVDGL